MLRTNGRGYRGYSGAGFSRVCWYTISPCEGVMHDKDGYDVCGCVRFQNGADGDEQN